MMRAPFKHWSSLTLRDEEEVLLLEKRKKSEEVYLLMARKRRLASCQAVPDRSVSNQSRVAAPLKDSDPSLASCLLSPRRRRSHEPQRQGGYNMQSAAMRAPQTSSQVLTYRVREGAILSDLPLLARRVAELFDGKRSVQEVFQAAQISEAKGDSVVRKLADLSILEPVSEASQNVTTMSELESSRTLRIGPARGEFSPVEEAFFASEVQPIDECEEPLDGLGERVGFFFTRLFMRVKQSPAI
jgi:hypothetical protein